MVIKKKLKMFSVPIRGFANVEAETKEDALNYVLQGKKKRDFEVAIKTESWWTVAIRNIGMNLGVMLSFFFFSLFIFSLADAFDSIMKSIANPYVAFLAFAGYIWLIIFFVKALFRIKISGDLHE